MSKYAERQTRIEWLKSQLTKGTRFNWWPRENSPSCAEVIEVKEDGIITVLYCPGGGSLHGSHKTFDTWEKLLSYPELQIIHHEP